MMNMILFGNNKILLILTIILMNIVSSAVSLENKIIIKVNNEIITNIDIKNEINYLKALNVDIKNLSNQEIEKIAKKSLIREKIRKLELLNYTKKIEIDEKYKNNILKSRYSKLGINSKNEFLKYLYGYNLKITEIEKKISIQAIWNQLIFSKFSNKVKIDKNELQKRISIENNKNIKNYLMSEILFNVESNNNLKKKFDEIKNSILNVGFENAALIYSVSDSSKIGGRLGWIKESSLNKDIQNNLSKLNINDITDPKVVPGGFLILKIQDIRFDKVEVDIEKELKILTRLETNRQLSQYSNIYYNKIKKNFQVDEL
jgi:peptidyl-prolyl cis-trans isomerase SurA